MYQVNQRCRFLSWTGTMNRCYWCILGLHAHAIYSDVISFYTERVLFRNTVDHFRRSWIYYSFSTKSFRVFNFRTNFMCPLSFFRLPRIQIYVIPGWFCSRIFFHLSFVFWIFGWSSTRESFGTQGSGKFSDKFGCSRTVACLPPSRYLGRQTTLSIFWPISLFGNQ